MDNLPPKYIAAFALAFAAMLGWNAFLIVRDNKMFEGYKQRQSQICAELKSFHPDCQR